MTFPAGPAYLPPTWRYANDDWAGSNALIYTVYTVLPVYQTDVNGNVVYGQDGNPIVTTPGTPMNLTGYTVIGAIAQRQVEMIYANDRFGRQTPGPPLNGVTGSILSASTGRIALSVSRPNTAIVTPQSIADWYADVQAAGALPSGIGSRLIATPVIVDPSSIAVTVGKQSVYVF